MNDAFMVTIAFPTIEVPLGFAAMYSHTFRDSTMLVTSEYQEYSIGEDLLTYPVSATSRSISSRPNGGSES